MHVCRRLFRRESDKARHKCITERDKPVSEQSGAVQCQRCKRWWRSKGGFAVHRYVPLKTQTQTRQQIRQPLVCIVCERTFSRPGDKKRHKRIVEREKRIKEQQGTVKCNNAVSTVNNGLEVKVY